MSTVAAPAAHARMSVATTSTAPPHSSTLRLRSVMTALGFFSTATMRTARPAAAAARSARETSGPRPAPTTARRSGAAVGGAAASDARMAASYWSYLMGSRSNVS